MQDKQSLPRRISNIRTLHMDHGISNESQTTEILLTNNKKRCTNDYEIENNDYNDDDDIDIVQVIKKMRFKMPSLQIPNYSQAFDLPNRCFDLTDEERLINYQHKMKQQNVKKIKQQEIQINKLQKQLITSNEYKIDTQNEIINFRLKLFKSKQKNNKINQLNNKNINNLNIIQNQFEQYKLNKQKEINKYREIIQKLENRLQTTVDNKNQYKCIVYGLKSAYLYGMGPRDNVEMIKGEDRINYSLTIMNWKEKEKEKSNIMITNHNQNIHYLMIQKLETYINNNNKYYNYDNPLITVNGIINNLKHFVYVFIIGSNYRIPSLQNQKGVKAKQEISSNIIIGQYKGNEYEEQEWHNKFDYTNRDGINEHYLYGLDWLTINGKQRSITIDPIDANLLESPLIRINDCRLNIFDEIATEQDKQRQNCKFLNCRIYGWPSTFIVTTKKILVGEELFINYGQMYSKLMHETERWQQIVKVNKKNIDNLFGDTIDNKIID